MRPLGKFVGRQPLKIPAVSQDAEQLAHFAVDMFGIAEHAAFLGNAYGSGVTGPGINVLKKVPMDGAAMGVAQSSFRKRLGCPLSCDFSLERIKLCLIAQVQL